jgi:hypothetical protein
MRPCPWISCKYHLAVEVLKTGHLKEVFPDTELEDLPQTCVLDIADGGPKTLGEVGTFLNLTRERIRQMEAKGIRRAMSSREIKATIARDKSIELDQKMLLPMVKPLVLDRNVDVVAPAAAPPPAPVATPRGRIIQSSPKVRLLQPAATSPRVAPSPPQPLRSPPPPIAARLLASPTAAGQSRTPPPPVPAVAAHARDPWFGVDLPRPQVSIKPESQRLMPPAPAAPAAPVSAPPAPVAVSPAPPPSSWAPAIPAPPPALAPQPPAPALFGGARMAMGSLSGLGVPDLTPAPARPASAAPKPPSTPPRVASAPQPAPRTVRGDLSSVTLPMVAIPPLVTGALRGDLTLSPDVAEDVADLRRRIVMCKERIVEEERTYRDLIDQVMAAVTRSSTPLEPTGSMGHVYPPARPIVSTSGHAKPKKKQDLLDESDVKRIDILREVFVESPSHRFNSLVFHPLISGNRLFNSLYAALKKYVRLGWLRKDGDFFLWGSRQDVPVADE